MSPGTASRRARSHGEGPAVTVHLLRHGEVHNPEGVLYGRLPGYHLSADGVRMAEQAAEALRGRPLAVLRSSPLERAQETLRPLAEVTGLPVSIDDRLIEAGNAFEGLSFGVGDGSLRRPRHWLLLRNPFRPSWGEPYAEVAERMLAAARAVRDDVLDATGGESGEAVCVSHQLPIWTARRAAEGRPLWHRPDLRQCGLASLTSLTWVGDRLATVTYSEPLGAAARREVTPGA
jgi:broad specificity phosphatase PhoE